MNIYVKYGELRSWLLFLVAMTLSWFAMLQAEFTILNKIEIHYDYLYYYSGETN